MTTFPPELVEIIVHDIWNSEMPSFVRKSFMTTCPWINRTWKAVYAPIASQDMYITNLTFLDYLCDISRTRKSIIYHDFIPRLTRAITCFVDLRENNRKEQQKGFIVISLSYPIFVVSGLCSNLFIIYLSRSFGRVLSGRSHLHHYYHRSVIFPFESPTTGSCLMPLRTTIEATLGRHECVYIFP